MEWYEKIKMRREELGMSQQDLAKALGYKDRSTIAKIESGINEISLSKMVAFSEALKTSIINIISDNEEKKPATFRHELSPDEVDLLDKYRAASEEKKNAIHVLIKSK